MAFYKDKDGKGYWAKEEKSKDSVKVTEEKSDTVVAKGTTGRVSRKK